MHDIEPHHLWRDNYIASEDRRSPHFGRIYDEFTFSNRIYNYYIHPQWDEFGSATLYAKILYVDYEERTAIIELIGEWNDCLSNDVLFLKQNIADSLTREGISKFVLIMDHVLNFHGSDDCYYEEWYEDIMDNEGYIYMLNLQEHVFREMQKTGLDVYVRLDLSLQLPNWRAYSPKGLIGEIEAWSTPQVRRLF
ncbi:MAG: hypothetical protein HKN76_04780 [Saprospiraceae bacterium]|nr:hypothetical protein [Saprospiraceae bacterium]